jgi:SAM-dependent methyltransferase
VAELVVPSELCRNAVTDSAAALDGAVWLIDHMARHLGVSDLGGLDVLDFGCGVRFTQAFINRGLPIGHYTGVDVSREVIDFLRAEVSDPGLEHYHLDAYNERYNPTGQPLETMTVPEIEGRRFDLICLFSVFTHLEPADYVAMLRLLQRFVKPDGRLFFTVFLNEVTEGGYGYIDRVSKGVAAAAAKDPSVKKALASRGADREPPDYMDVNPDDPLWVALYSRRHALGLIEETGWRVLEVAPPDVHLQHHVVCAPSTV